MNKFNEKITELKLKIDENQNKYHELKTQYNLENDKLIKNEYLLKSLINNQTLSNDKLNSSNLQLIENKLKLNNNEIKINQLNEKIISLSNFINDLELKFDELSISYTELNEELRSIHQMIDGI